MLETILQFDIQLFCFINKSLANDVTNFIMPIITDFKFWLPFFMVFCVYQLWKGGINGRLCIISLILGVIITDQIVSGVIKELVARPRPCHVLIDINLLVGCGAGKSFPSSHSANSMMACAIISLFFRRYKYWLPFISIIIGISRLFVGVHHPLDVLCGWIIGWLFGWGVYKLVMFLYKRYLEPKLNKK